MSFVEIETASQPECWRRAAELAPSRSAALPAAGERIAVVGCGTSFYMAQAYAALREESGQGESDAFAASEFPFGRRYDRVVALTRSGTTTEVLDLLGRLHGVTRTVAITADPNTPVMTAADDVVVLDFADEQSVVQTRFATTAFTLLRAHLGLHTDAVVRDAETALAEPLPEGLLDCTQFTFLGRGWTAGLANEAALKMKEASLSWTESYPAMEYRHGPISITTTGTATWMFGAAPEGLDDQVLSTGARWVESGLDPLAELVRVQRLAIARAEAAGIDPDSPRHLTRSVVLADA
ncbi:MULTISPECIES: SIS domain-containing protein [unclassified Streptomyces]|uniref:SIS domain-containing protein n=1 Tax=unclassified Streptomyces TaxID=2593676 RepID=UPI0008867731|nr:MULTISPECIES: SIS domain-containing protein [unclassified Streptomyces]MDX2730822.1 SIS domain-containing protein [Streptomyces sp. PA03-2a]MDX3767930.1 SIS domain-containing protein [Streptomyces sp. AK08-01B]MDX3818157.1 SIS domain-containing protein [Streptomyces sp. AK08-01A]SCZ08994.1 Fructoselysine-6-P-deglycase FrlB with duplicated sugar isomerase (SIS) domain [Streptomyces sp. 136MFCol5.1]SFT27950.1 Fructoselysine-6-P-deglycase FrlB with duplicated sugar isomerase (SIS) domain [Stre